MSSKSPASKAELAPSRPVYELRATGLSGSEMALAIWQLPSPATPRLSLPERIAGLEGRRLQYVETRILRRLRQADISLAGVKKNETKSLKVDEDLALGLALLFRALAPMHSEGRMLAVAEGIEKLTREEAGYWMGMSIHRVNPRRVLAALRILLTTA